MKLQTMLIILLSMVLMMASCTTKADRQKEKEPINVNAYIDNLQKQMNANKVTRTPQVPSVLGDSQSTPQEFWANTSKPKNVLSDSQVEKEFGETEAANSTTRKRIALVIGNSSYKESPLKNPLNDAQDMKQVLLNLGFDVIHRENLNQNDMKRAITEFGAKIHNGDVGLFYYAGHGVQVSGENYLVPVDAKVEKEEDIDYECVRASFVSNKMGNDENSTHIIILDACRSNPFARSFRSTSQGLAPMNALGGTLVAYATAPGSVASDGNARNGLYTQELLRFMQTPNLKIEDLFKRVRVSVRELTQNKQTPWEASSIVVDFCFVGASQSAPPVTQSTFSPSSSVTKFHFYYKFGDMPGEHFWTKINQNTWTETYPDGRSAGFRFVGNINVEGDKGTMLRQIDEPHYEYFIPDKGGRIMFIRIRLKNGEWSFLGDMQDIQ